MIRPSTTAGYGSESVVSHGATACTRSSGFRTYMIFESALMELLNRMFRSWYSRANAMRLKRLPIGTPPVPV